MSLQVAILESSREVLREMLAPELADRLARSIVERASGRIDEAIGEFLGVDRDAGKRRTSKLKASGRTRGVEAVDAAEEPEAYEGNEVAENTEAA